MKRDKAKLSGNFFLTLYFISKLVPMGISCVAIYLGYRLFVLGVTGQASLVVKADTFGGQLLNAAPGLFFAVGGIIALIIAVWKGSAFTFARKVPDEYWAFCLPQAQLWNDAEQSGLANTQTVFKDIDITPKA